MGKGELCPLFASIKMEVAEIDEPVTAVESEELHTEEPKAKPKKRRKTTTDYVIEFVIKVVATAIAVWVLCAFVVGIHVNHGNSSYPMIKDGDLVITYRIGALERGEEIAYEAGGKTCFGRIVAKSGDEVEITESCVMVNGYMVTEDVVYPTTAEGSKITFPYIVPEDSVFVLNDFRSDINDSRTFGAVPLNDCEGKVILVVRRRGI